ncbi:response regulator [Microbispora rosea]|uniref:response regulator n=1 Tax=Microbispora rosea TaxID=58117 RepID=UPI0004C2CF78|nr:response regulator transcription factor [Microbispora rosea]
MITVLLVDDQVLVRKGFGMIVNAQGDMCVAGEAGDGEQAVRLCAELRPDVVLMDVHLPGLDGIAATEQITAALPGVRVLALSMYDMDEYVVDMLRAGASGFLPKDISPEDLVESVRVVHRGESAVAPRLLTRLISAFVRAGRPRGFGGHGAAGSAGAVGALSEREREVLLLIGRGLSNSEIARALLLAPSTVKNHVTNVFAKIGARDRAQAVITAYESGLITPGE